MKSRWPRTSLATHSLHTIHRIRLAIYLLETLTLDFDLEPNLCFVFTDRLTVNKLIPDT